MIQRIQTLYLLAATVCIAFVLSLPLCRFLVVGEEFALYAFGIKSATNAEIMMPSLYMGILAVICALLPLVAIFLFRRRILQMRLCMGAMILTFALQLFVCYYIWRSDSVMEGFAANVSAAISLTAVLPLIATLLLWLAHRGIFRDEMLVRSVDRIR